MSHPSVLIVGAGVMGASVAYHLAARGCRDVLVIDRGHGPGAGSTSRATGGFRAQFATSINIRLSLLARDKLRRFNDETGGDAGYVQSGYLWLASDDRELAALRRAQRLQHDEGLTEATELALDEIGRLNPAVDPDGLVGGTFCPTDGFIRPTGILEGYLSAASRSGVRFEWGVNVRSLERKPDGTVDSAVATNGRRYAGTFVNAAGAWAGELARTCGLDLPVTPLRRQVAQTAPTEVLPPTMPMTIFVEDGFHLRVRDGRVLLLWPTPGAPGRAFDESVDPDWIDAVSRKAHARLPILRSVPVERDRCWAGLYEMSPDRHAILGASEECPNLYFVNGSSGHGVMHAPALGQLLAEVILDGRATTLDVSPLRPERFSQDALNPVSGFL